ncbi:hypothetical protein OG21DRAFT_336717 [Imleria badia]|nr:hypothetical protein OG21DRAFT_336717 [Imleria badia]
MMILCVDPIPQVTAAVHRFDIGRVEFELSLTKYMSANLSTPQRLSVIIGKVLYSLQDIHPDLNSLVSRPNDSSNSLLIQTICQKMSQDMIWLFKFPLIQRLTRISLHLIEHLLNASFRTSQFAVPAKLDQVSMVYAMSRHSTSGLSKKVH